MRITVMGLGLHGGGTATAAFFASHGADVTVTDLRSKKELSASVRQLESFPINYTLGRHDVKDFKRADVVIKNPGVPRNSPFLQAADRVESDISVFLRLVDPPLLAVTGSKGKSTTVSALYHVMRKTHPGVKLGGNITLSPLTFVDELLDGPQELPPVILELSSWQLADLRDMHVLNPRICCITNILYDHQNRYARFEDYVDDKREIFRSQDRKGISLFLYDAYGKDFAAEGEGEGLFFSPSPLPQGTDGGWLRDTGEGVFRYKGRREILVPKDISVPGAHTRLNLLCAGMMASLYGADNDSIRESLASFPGIPHRLEFVAKKDGISFYNDSASTIPDAVVQGVRSFTEKCVLITGGTDKNLDFTPYESILHIPEAFVLIAGTGTEKIIPMLQKHRITYCGPYNTMEEICRNALERAASGGVVLFSPGSASFELFENEFHRGETFKEQVKKICV